MTTPYSEDDLDEAIAHSVAPAWWAENGRGSLGYARVLALREAMFMRWLRRMPEDHDALVIRQAWDDLCTLGHFSFDLEEKA